MKCRAQITSAAVAIAFFASVPIARSEEWFHFNPRDWELTLDFEGSQRRIDGGTTTDLDLEERLRVRQDGHVLDPRIATFKLDIEFGFEQGRFSTPDRSDTTDGFLTNYDVSTSLLHGTVFPVSFAGQMGRGSGTLDTGFGGRTEYVNKTRNATLRYRNPYFPSGISYSERLTDSTFQSGTGATTERAETRRTISIKGRSRKLDLTLEHDWFDDRASAIDRDYEESKLRANHSVRWGRGSSLLSRVNYWDRTGHRPRDRLDVEERARLQHSTKLNTSYRYRFGFLKQEIETLSHAALVEATHNLFNNLTSNLAFSGSLVDSDVTTEKEYEGKLRLDYRKKKLIWGGDLTAGLGIGYGVTDRESSGSLLEAIGETQTVPTNIIVLLNERFIDTATIIVTDQTGAITYAEGPDYMVVPTGADRVELHIVSGGQIAIAQTILVDYKYQSLPTQKFSRLPYNSSVGLDFGWLNLYQRMNGERQRLISGQDEAALNERQEFATGAELRWRRPATTATLGAESRFFDSTGFSSTSYTFRQALTYQFTPRDTLTTSATENFQETDGRNIALYTARVTLNWRPLQSLTIKPYANAWIRNTEPAPQDMSDTTEDIYVRAGLDLHWRVRQTELAVRYYHDRRTGTLNDNDEDRLKVTLSRKF